MRMWRFALPVMSAVLLSGCNTIEHRKETITKAPLPILAENSIKPQLLWSNNTTSGVGNSDAKLRLAVTSAEVVAIDNKGKILVLDRVSGKLKWKVSSKAEFTAGPTVFKDKILAGTDDGYIMSYQLSNGELSWKTKVGGSVLAAPEGDENTVFAHVLNGSLFALNAQDGRLLWRYHADTPPLMLRRSSSSQISKAFVVVGLANGKLIALNRTDGTLEWDQEIAVSKGRSDIQRMVDISADPVIKDETIYAVSYQGKIAALQLETGAPIWERELSSYSGIAVASRSLFVTDVTGVLWSLDRKSGSVLWKQAALSGRRLSAPALLQDDVIVGDEDGYLHWISQRDGSYKGRILVDSKGIDATPIVKDNIIYVLGCGGKVVAITPHSISDKVS